MNLHACRVLAFALAVCPQIALAQIVSPSTEADKAASRFPQPVRVGDLPGRTLLAPAESQPVLGHVSGVVRRQDGGVNLVVSAGGWFGIGARRVAVPVEAVGLMGEYVALLDIKPDQLRSLPTFDPAAASEIASGETIRVGLSKPFH